MEELKEEWKSIPNTVGYYISNYGRCKIVKSKKHPKGIIKNPGDFCVDADGYERYTYRDINGKSKFRPVHRLVAELFLPKIDGKNIINHIDSNRKNNKVTNLEWVTPKENVYHSYQFGNRRKCLEVPRCSKLTSFQISQIPLLRQYYSLKKIADLYNISYTSMKNIIIRYKKLSQDNQQPSIYGGNYK